MKSKKSKIAVLIAAILCVVASILVIAAATDSIDDCKTHFTAYEASVAQQYIDGEKDGVAYPAENGYIFAGWYTEENAVLENVIRETAPEGTVYALFVPEHVLGVKAQVSGYLLDEDTTNDAKADIRFITTVNSLVYKGVGFDITYTDGSQEYINKAESKTVYQRLYQMGSDSKEEDILPKTTFCDASTYFMTHTITNVPDTFYTTDFTVKPYWITMDGEKVYGVTEVKSIEDGCKRDTVWVSKNGTDKYSCGTEDAPYATIEYAKAHVSEGGTIWVKDAFTNNTSDANGTVTVPGNYKYGDNVTITVAGNTDYACNSLKMNGETIAPDAKGVYTFKPEGLDYKVVGTFAKALFENNADNTDWNMAGQFFGKLSATFGQYANKGGDEKTSDLYTVKDTYKEIAMTIKNTKPDAHDFCLEYDFLFTSGDKFVLRLDNTDANVGYRIQTMSGNTVIGNWKSYNVLTAAEKAKVDADGVEFKVAIVGDSAHIYIDGRQVQVINFTKSINGATAQIKAVVYGNVGDYVEVPVSLKEATVAVKATN